MAGSAGSELSRGGMKTKIEAAKIATAAGAAMVIASGRVKNPLAAIDAGGAVHLVRAAGDAGAARERPGSPGIWSRAGRLSSMRARRRR